MGTGFEEDQIVIEPLFKRFFGKRIKIQYEKIERIEMPPGDSVYFYMKNGKVIRVPDPGIVTFYTGFGEMLKKYRIPYKCLLEDSGGETIETVRENATDTRKAVLEYANPILEEKLGPGYELEAKIVERIVGTTIEFRLLKNGIVLEEANGDESIDGEPLVDEMDLAFLTEWDPVYEQGKYAFADETNDTSALKEYIDGVVLDNIFTCNAPFTK